MPARARQTASFHLSHLLLLVMALFFGPSTALAQDTEDPVGQAIDAWLHIVPWVNELYVPTADRITSEDGLGPKLDGVSIMLRFRGRVIGIGSAHERGTDTLRQATAAAVRDALDSRRVRDLPIDMTETIGRETTIELEIMKKPVPLLGTTYEEMSASIRPGVDGIAIRRGDNWRLAYPGRMQAFGLADRPERTMVRLLRELGLPPQEPSELRKIDDVQFYRFEVTVLTQRKPGGLPFESVRGADTVGLPESLGAMARDISDGAAANLMGRLASDPRDDVGDIPGAARLATLGLFGDYDVITDKYTPLVAPPAAQALAAWALADTASRRGDLEEAVRNELRRVADLIMQRLGQVDDIEEDPLADHRCIPLIVLAGLELYTDEPGDAAALTAPPIVDKARTVFLEGITSRSKAGEEGEDVPVATGAVPALDALAACALCADDPGVLDRATAHDLVNTAWEGTQVDRLVGVLHFLLLAERTLPGNPNTESHKAASQHLMEASIANQIGHSDSLTAPTPPVRDLAGGFVLSGSPRPTAASSSLRPALALAMMAGNDWLPRTDRRAAWEEALGLALRFARQLQIDANQDQRASSPQRARGGVKSAPWSNLSRTSDTALALLLANEIIDNPAR